MSRGDLQTQDLSVLKLLGEARKSMTTKSIADQLNLKQRTVQRILQAAEAAGFPIARDPAGMLGGVRMVGDFSLKVTLPTDLVEMAALIAAQQLMRQAAAETVLGQAFEQLAHRLLAQIKPGQREICERFARLYQTRQGRPVTASPIAATVHRAADTCRVLVIQYRSSNEAKARRREIEPLGIYSTPERSYVVARDSKKAAIRVFALDRILGAHDTQTAFRADPSFDVAKFFSNSLGVFVGEPVDLEMRLAPEAYRRMGKKLPHPSARIVRRPDGGAAVHFSAALSDELLAWMVSLGPGVATIAPPVATAFVRDAFAKRIADQPKPARLSATKTKSRKAKPIQLPGPLVARMRSKR